MKIVIDFTNVIILLGILAAIVIIVGSVELIDVMFHLAFKYPKKYAFNVSATLATFIVDGYVLYNPSILSTLNEKVLPNIVFGVAMFAHFIVVLSALKIANGILRGE